MDVIRVTRCPVDPAQLRGFRIDAPTEGVAANTTALHFGGWVLPRSGRAVAVEVLHKGRQLKRVPVNGSRSDLVETYPHVPEVMSCGFSGSVGTIGLPAETDLSLVAILDDDRRVHVGEITFRRECFVDGYQPKLQPLIVNSLGRTGTTWLMRILSSHPEIVIRDKYPYETRCAIYWIHMFSVLSQPADHFQSAHPDNFHYDRWHVGHHPAFVRDRSAGTVERWFEETYVKRLSVFCRSTTEAFYNEIASFQNLTNPRYFGEKLNPGILPVLFWELYPETREIILVRDMRDVICSILAFNKKRGYAGFGRDRATDDIDYVRRMRGSATALLEDYRDRASSAYLLKYEDLVTTPHRCLAELLSYLRLESNAKVIESMLQLASRPSPEMAAHRTAGDPQHSIGRWRTELSAEMQTACEDALGDVLREFGYV